MKRKIIGVTVGTTIPKPNLNQTDPRKGDYVRGKESLVTDWNAAEGQTGHILNRTHWVENGRTEVLSELVFTSHSGNGTSLKEPIGLTAGKTYIVNWNGIEYKCTAFSVPLDDGSASTWTATAIGDWDSINNNTEPVTGEPFGICEYTQPELIEAFGKALYIKPREDTIHDCTVSIYEEIEIIHKLDGKYLPNGIPYLEGGGEPVELLPPTKLEGSDGEFFVPADAGIVLADGETYVVNWNGTEYTCTAQYFETDGESAIVMGNIGLAFGTGEDTGEPFVILYSEMLAAMGASLYVIRLAGDTEVTLGLAGSPPVKIHKLDNRCLDLAWLPTAEKVETEVLPRTAFNSNVNTPLTRSGLPIGTNVSVIFDGVRYECAVIETIINGDAQWITVGNMAILNAEEFPDTGEPFCFHNLLEYGPYAIQFADGGSHAVSVYVTESTINKMPEEFMPESMDSVVLRSPGGLLFKLAVDDNGTLSATAI